MFSLGNWKWNSSWEPALVGQEPRLPQPLLIYHHLLNVQSSRSALNWKAFTNVCVPLLREHLQTSWLKHWTEKGLLYKLRVKPLTLFDPRTGQWSGFQSNIHAAEKYNLSFILVHSLFRSIRVNLRKIQSTWFNPVILAFPVLFRALNHITDHRGIF